MARRKLSDAPAELSDQDKEALNQWLQKKINDGDLPRRFWDRDVARRTLEHCLIWHRARGIQRCSWLATAQEWFRKQAELDGWNAPRSRRRPRKRPKQERLELDTRVAENIVFGPLSGSRGGSPEPLSEVIANSKIGGTKHGKRR
jgi:hypothetical protein